MECQELLVKTESDSKDPLDQLEHLVKMVYPVRTVRLVCQDAQEHLVRWVSLDGADATGPEDLLELLEALVLRENQANRLLALLEVQERRDLLEKREKEV